MNQQWGTTFWFCQFHLGCDQHWGTALLIVMVPVVMSINSWGTPLLVLPVPPVVLTVPLCDESIVGYSTFGSYNSTCDPYQQRARNNCSTLKAPCRTCNNAMELHLALLGMTCSQVEWPGHKLSTQLVFELYQCSICDPAN
jgi:hypothetical protein